MQTQIQPTNKLASLGTVGLLFLAGITGMVFLLPLQSAHAATATLTPSVTSGTVGSFITLTGTGFAPGQDVAVEFGTTLITTFGQAQAYPTVSSILDTHGIQAPEPLNIACAVATPCIETDANGWFSAIIAVPPVVGGSVTITATDGVNTGTSSFTVTPALVLSTTSGFPDQLFAGATITATGFQASDIVTLGGTAITSSGAALSTLTITAGSSTALVTLGATSRSGLTYTSGPGVGQLGLTMQVAEIAGGKLAVTGTGTGGTSDIASATFTVNPTIAIYNAQSGATLFSMLASGSVLLGGSGFAAGTVAANSITITATGGSTITTQNAAVTVGADGGIGVGGPTGHIVVIPNGNVPQGPATITIVDGTNTYTFSYANHNILQAATTDSAGTVISTATLWNGGTGVTGAIKGFGGPFLVSSLGGAGHTALGYLDSASYKPANSGTTPIVTVMAVGYANGVAGITSTTNIPGGTNPTWGAATSDANGAFFVVSTASLPDEPYTANGYTVTLGLGTDGSALNPTLNILPYIKIGGSATISAQSLGTTVTFHGFTGAATCTVTAGGAALVLGGVCTTSSAGATGAIAISTAGDQAGTLNLPGGANTITGSDGTVTGTAGVFVLPTDSWGGTINTALSVNAAPPGQITILRTGLTAGGIPFGVNGLTPNTAYTVVMDPGAPTQTTLGSGFTSNAAGGIPAPGVQFAVPVGSAGMHVVAIMAGTTNVFFNVVATTLNGGTSVSSTAVAQPGIANPSISDPSNNEVTSLNANARGQYGDGILTIGANLIASPSAVNVGTSSSILTISGSGVVAGTTYELSTKIGALNGNNIPATCPLGTAGNVVSGVFTATSTGSVPAATTLQLVDMPTVNNGVVNGEVGTLYCAYASTAAQFPGASTGVATFDVQASATLNMTSAPSGHAVVLNAHGLAANTFYNVIYNTQITSGGIITGTIIGGLLSNNVGGGVSTINAPTTSLSTITVQLQSAAEAGEVAGIALANPPTLSIGVSSGTCNTTSCLVSSAASTETTIGANKAVQSSFTNNSNAPVTAIVYAVVRNALGQTVSYSTATVTANAGGSVTAYNILFGLAPGTYSVSVFATSTSGTAISTSSTVSVTI